MEIYSQLRYIRGVGDPCVRLGGWRNHELSLGEMIETGGCILGF